MKNDPDRHTHPLPLSLIRAPDAAGLLAAALPILGVRHWAQTCAVLGGLGLADCAIAADTPRIGAAEDDDLWPNGFAHPDGAMRLTVAIDRRLTAWTCARRFGGTSVATSARRRGGSVERTIARQIAEAVRADLGCVSWDAVDGGALDGVAALRHLSFALDGDPLSLIRLALTGASATPATRALPSNWVEQLRALGGQVRLPVRSVLARPVLSAGEVARLAVGDVIPIRAPDRVALLSGRHKLAVGHLDECDGHAAVRLDPQVEAQ